MHFTLFYRRVILFLKSVIESDIDWAQQFSSPDKVDLILNVSMRSYRLLFTVRSIQR